MALAPVKIVIAGIDKYSGKLSKSLANTKRYAKNMNAIGKKMAVGVSAPIMLAGVKILKTSAIFEKSMNHIEALTGAPQKELEKMSVLAKELGANTELSATSAADAMGFLGMAGWETNNILKATPHLLDLATASSTAMAETADYVSNIMGAFGENADNIANVVDILAGTTSSANVTLTDLAETMKKAAPIAAEFGASLKDTATIAGFLGNIGIQGTEAGTAIKNIFLALAAPEPKALKWFKRLEVNTKDLQGNLRPVPDVFKDLGTKLKALPNGDRLAAIKTIFGKLSIAGAAKLSNDLGKTNSQFMRLAKTMENVNGKNKAMANIMRKGLAGEYDALISSLEGLAIAIGESGLVEMMTKLTKKLSTFFRSLTKANPELLNMGVIVAGLLAALAPILIIGAKLITVFAAIGTTVAEAGGIVALLSNPLGWIIGAVVLLTAAFSFFFFSAKKEGEPFFNFLRSWAHMVMYFPALLFRKFDRIAPYFKLMGILIGNVFSGLETGALGGFFSWLGSMFDWVFEKFDWLIDGAFNLADKLMGVLYNDEDLKAAGFTGAKVGDGRGWLAGDPKTDDIVKPNEISGQSMMLQPKINIKVEKAAPDTKVTVQGDDDTGSKYFTGLNSFGNNW